MDFGVSNGGALGGLKRGGVKDLTDHLPRALRQKWQSPPGGCKRASSTTPTRAIRNGHNQHTRKAGHPFKTSYESDKLNERFRPTQAALRGVGHDFLLGEPTQASDGGITVSVSPEATWSERVESRLTAKRC